MRGSDMSRVRLVSSSCCECSAVVVCCYNSLTLGYGNMGNLPVRFAEQCGGCGGKRK